MNTIQYKNRRIISKLIAPNTLTKEARLLCFVSLGKCINHCPKSYTSSLSLFFTLDTRLIDKTKHIELNYPEVESLFKTIEKDRVITDFPYLAALTTPLNFQLTSSYLDKYNQYKAMILLACIKLEIIGSHQSAISCALREIRLIAQNKEHFDILQEIPSPNDYPLFDNLLTALENLRANINNPTKERFVSYLHVVLKDAHKNKPGITHRREINFNPDIEETLSLSVSSITEDTPYEVTELSAINSNEHHLDEASSAYSTQAVKFNDPQNTHKSISLRYIQEKRLTEQLSYRNLSLPCSVEQLSNWDIRQLISGIATGIKSQKDSNTATMLLLILLTGREFESLFNYLNNGQAVRYVDGYGIFIISHSVPKSTIPQKLSTILEPVKSNLFFILPQLIEKNDFDHLQVSIDDINEFIALINKQHTTRITLGRIERYLEHWYKNHGIDRTEIAILKGKNHQQTAALSYSQINSDIVYIHHREYTESLFEKANLSPKFKPLKPKRHPVGSSLFLPPNILRNQFKLLGFEITKQHDNKEEKNNPSQIVFERHNHFVTYVWALLAFVTGHRDVNAPLGKLEDFNPFNKTWWICDKAIKSNRSARSIVLPDTAIKQLDFYLKYLKELLKWSKLIYPAIAEKCHESLSSESNLLFALDTTQQSNGNPIELTPTVIKNTLNDKFLFPNNWPRHHIRSALLNKPFPPELIDAWMGHANIGEAAFNSLSQLAFSELKDIAYFIEELLIKHEIEAIAACQIH